MRNFTPYTPPDNPGLYMQSSSTDHKLPLVFSRGYDIRLWGMEKLHPFDSCKYGHVFRLLREKGIADGKNHHVPAKVSDTDLLRVHSAAYLKSLRRSRNIARIAEVPPLRFVPNFLLQRRVLLPMKRATGGSQLGVDLAFRHGWAINLSGGYHHAKRDSSSGFCFFSDIALAAQRVFEIKPSAYIMVVDLDAHQGNGFESIFGRHSHISTLDVYNGQIYPQDYEARKYIQYNFPLSSGTTTYNYLSLLNRELPKALDAEIPDFIIYNAGTDIFEEDRLGQLKVSKRGILERDAKVFEEAFRRKTPILMLLSGGYTRASAGIIADSIENIVKRFELIPQP